MSITFKFVGDSNLRNVVAYFSDRDEPLQQADSTHPHFDAIVDGLVKGDESVYDLFDVRRGIGGRLRALSDRVSVDGDNVYYDGDLVDGPIAQHLSRVLAAGGDFEPVVKFWDKVSSNPDKRSREQLFSWLQAKDFTITEDGDIVMYKKVRRTDDGYESVNSGGGFVNGVAVDGRIPQKVGDVVTLPRSEVHNNPNTACARGLHAAHWNYAQGFSGDTLLEVHVNPRDVVSVPSDSGVEKVRCCRYVVVGEVEKRYATPILGLNAKEYDPESDVAYRG